MPEVARSAVPRSPNLQISVISCFDIRQCTHLEDWYILFLPDYYYYYWCLAPSGSGQNLSQASLSSGSHIIKMASVVYVYPHAVPYGHNQSAMLADAETVSKFLILKDWFWQNSKIQMLTILYLKSLKSLFVRTTWYHDNQWDLLCAAFYDLAMFFFYKNASLTWMLVKVSYF